VGQATQLETDYLVVGAGAMGMAFVDTVIDDPKADVIMVDRRSGPGGHWLDSYPFVQVHQPSRVYGVNSTPLGRDRIESDGRDAGFYERASGPEICGYYDDVMRYRLLASGRVRFFPMSEYLGDRRFRSLVTDHLTEVTVRRALVDATYVASRVPATDPPPFEVADGARCVPVGELVGITEAPAGYVVIGGGKTAMDACVWLLDRGARPDDITWIRPRDSWLLNRAYFQPGGSAVSTFEAVVLQIEAMAASASIEEAFERAEAQDVVFRIDRDVRPTIMRGATVSAGELEQLRRIGNVVRMGHVQRVEAGRIVLDEGEISTSPRHVHVHCASPGLGVRPARPIFTDDTITPQCISRISVTMSSALAGYVESTGRTTEEKNRLCPANPLPDTPFDWMRGLLGGVRAEMGWQDAGDVQAWLEASRLNLLQGMLSRTDDEVRDLQARFLSAVFPALDKLDEFAAVATPAERERMVDPLAER
jgi:hypothetical protein